MVFQRLRAFRKHPYVAAVMDNIHVQVFLRVLAAFVVLQLLLTLPPAMMAMYRGYRYVAMLAAELAEMTPLEREVFGVREPVVITPVNIEQWAEHADQELYWPERPRYRYTVNGEKIPIWKSELLNPENQIPWLPRGCTTIDNTPRVAMDSVTAALGRKEELTSAESTSSELPIGSGSTSSELPIGSGSMPHAKFTIFAETLTMAEPEMGTSSASTTIAELELPTIPIAGLATFARSALETIAETARATFAEVALATIPEAELATLSQDEKATVVEVALATIPEAELATISESELATVVQVTLATVRKDELTLNSGSTTSARSTTIAGFATLVKAELTTMNSGLTKRAGSSNSVKSVKVLELSTVSRTEPATIHYGSTSVISINIALSERFVRLATSPNITAVAELETIADSATSPKVAAVASIVAVLKLLTFPEVATFAELARLFELMIGTDGDEGWVGSMQDLIEFAFSPRIYSKSKDRLGRSEPASNQFWAELGKLFAKRTFGPQLFEESQGLVEGIKQKDFLGESLDWACRTAMARDWASYGVWVLCLDRESRQ